MHTKESSSSSVPHCEANMQPKSRRKRQLENARAAKRMKIDGGEGIVTSRTESESPLEEPSLAQPKDPLESTSRSEDDSDFDPDTTLSADKKQKMSEEFIQDWVSVLSRDDLMSLVVTLDYLLDNCGVLRTAAAKKNCYIDRKE